MGNIGEFLHSIPVLNSETYRNILFSLIIVFILWIIRSFIIRIIVRRIEDIRTQYFWRKATKYITFVFGFLLLTRLWFEASNDLITFLSFLSAGIAIALKDILTNIAGWIIIIWMRPLAVGDRIQIGMNKGDVVDISLFHTTLMEIGNWVDSEQSTGRILKIPNGHIFTETLANYSKGFHYIWNEIPVLLTFESNWKKAKSILLNIAHKHAEHLSEEAEKRVLEASKRFMIFYTKLTPTVYTSVRESGVLLTIRYLSEPRRRRATEEVIWEEILQAFAECDDIDFAYQTTRFFNNAKEGKDKAKGESRT